MKTSIGWGEKDTKNVIANPDGIWRTGMCRTCQLKRSVCCSLDYTMGKPIGIIFTDLVLQEDGQIQALVCGEKITIDQTLIVHIIFQFERWTQNLNGHIYQLSY